MSESTRSIGDAFQVKDQKVLLFNPVNRPAGIEPSDDPVLAARFPAYAVSFRQRLN